MKSAILFTAFLISCGPSVTKPHPTTGKFETPDPKPGTTEKETEKKESLSRNDITQFVDLWFETQNRGEFERYKAFYGEGFSGVKRTGSKTKAFDRLGWLEDRARMFEKPMKVAGTEIHVTVDGESAMVRFVQSWESGEFRDVGPKELGIKRVDGNLFIFREEMLRSTALGANQTEFNFSLEDLRNASRIVGYTSDRVLREPRARHGSFCNDRHRKQGRCSLDWVDTSKALPKDITAVPLELKDAEAIFELLGDRKSYTQAPASCFDPRLQLAFYHKGEHLPFATIGICIECANAYSWPNINGLHAKLDAEKDSSGLGVAPEIRSWCRSVGLIQCTKHQTYFEREQN